MFCWIFRFLISNSIDTGNQLSPKLQRHIRHCYSCRQFYQTCLSLGDALKNQAKAQNQKITKHLSENIILSALNQQTDTTAQSFKLKYILAAACLFLAISATIFVVTHQKNQAAAPTDPYSEYRALIKQAVPPPLTSFIEQPFTSQFQDLAEDAKAAAQFLITCVAIDVPAPKNQSRFLNSPSAHTIKPPTSPIE